MHSKRVHKLTGIVILTLGILFFLRDIGVNMIGNTSGWTIIIVLVGAGVLAGDLGKLDSLGSQTDKSRSRNKL